MAKSRAVGIDLGTTYSAAAWVADSGESELIPNAEGDLLTPSVVLFDDTEIIVGKEAKKVSVADGDRVAVCAKRDMGKPVYSKPIAGRYLPPEVIQSYILRKIRRDIIRKIGPDFKVVITVPAYFDEPRRRATYQAGQVAGLEVLDILNEPTAAALAFGEEEGYLTKFGAPKERMRVVIYDLGGGTFDVTLIDMQPGDLKTICTDGDMQLGGHDWDMRLVDMAAEAFMKEFGDDPRQYPSSLQRLLVAAEEAKHTLSQRKTAKVFVTHQGRAMEVPVTREKLEEVSADLLDRTRYTTRRLLTAGGLEWKDIARVLLTGGSTRMPMVQKMLKELTGMEPSMSISPDEAVCRGAAIYANYLLASRGEGEHKPTFDVTNVNAHSLGIQGTDPETGRKRNKILIPRNTPLPAKKSAPCVTKQADQRSVIVEVLEGESLDPKQCSSIGKTIIRDLPPNLPKGWPIDVTYEYGVNGRLNVRAKVRGTDKEVSLELERDESMSADRMDRWKNVLANEGGLDAFDQAVMDDLDDLKKHAPAPKAPAAGASAASATTTASRPVPPPPQKPAAPPTAAGPTPTRPVPAPGAPTPQAPRPAAPMQPAAQGVAQPSTPAAAPQQPTVAAAPMVAFTCPHCRGVFHVPAALAGRQAQCPGCYQPIIVPQAAPRV
jgi:molecular chaperone DnaK